MTQEEVSSFFRERSSWLQSIESVMWGGQLNTIMNSFCFLRDTEKLEVPFLEELNSASCSWHQLKVYLDTKMAV